MINLGKVVIDKNKCIGCFKCKRVCYEVFEVGEDGLAKVRPGALHNIEEAETAVINCPTGAIRIVKDNSSNNGSSSWFFRLLENSDEEEK